MYESLLTRTVSKFQMNKRQKPETITESAHRHDTVQAFDKLSEISKMLLLLAILATLTGASIAVILFVALFLRMFP